jgi:hypothetical protein
VRTRIRSGGPELEGFAHRQEQISPSLLFFELWFELFDIQFSFRSPFRFQVTDLGFASPLHLKFELVLYTKPILFLIKP